MAQLPNRDKFEREIHDALRSLSGERRRQLERMLGSPPRVENVPTQWWEEFKRELEDELAAALLLLFIAMAESHGLSASAASSLAGQFASARASTISRAFIEHTQSGLMRAHRSAEGITPADIESAFGDGRLERLTTTEVTAAASAAGEAAVAQTVGLSELDTWYTVGDGRVCPVCSPLHAKPRSVWSRQFPAGPPAHVNCRCYVEYALEKSS